VQKELRQVKNEISQQSKRNFELENDLRFFDSKIAHLINHRITVEVSLRIVCHHNSPPPRVSNVSDLVYAILFPQELENRLEETPALPGKKLKSIPILVCASPPNHYFECHFRGNTQFYVI